MAWRLPIIDVGREGEGCNYVPRLFRNAPGLFYVGRVHEQVFTSVEVRRKEWGLDNRLGERRAAASRLPAGGRSRTATRSSATCACWKWPLANCPTSRTC